MDLTHCGWDIISSRASQLTASWSVRVRLKFRFEAEGQSYSGTKIVRVGLHDIQLETLNEDRIVQFARRKLEDYFDGDDPDELNLFLDCFDEQKLENLTSEQEVSLRKELSSIEEEFSTHCSEPKTTPSAANPV